MSLMSRRLMLRIAGLGSLAVGGLAVFASCGDAKIATTKASVERVGESEKIVEVTSSSGPISGTILVDGSSTVAPISAAVAEEFQGKFSGVRVPVGVSGTGGGFKKFCEKETDISNASRFIKSKEQMRCGGNAIEYIELPVAIDGIAVVVNPRNTAIGESITVEELNTVWRPEAEDTVTTWSQVRAGLPGEKMILYGPGTDSGTYDYFTKQINGEEGASRGDFTPSEDDNVLVQGVAGDVNALGFFGLAYYEQNQEMLKALKVDGGDGPVFPSQENVLSGKYAPLSRVIFIYVSTVAAERPEVQTFVEFYLRNAADLVGSVGYVQLPDKMYQMALERFMSRKTGTVSTRDGVSDTPNSVLEAWEAGA